jgi:hypothetical protein
MVEELSGAELLDSGSSPDLGARTNGTPTVTSGGTTGAMAPTDPIVHDIVHTEPKRGSEYELPRRPGLSLILDDIALIRGGQQPKNKLLLGVIGVVGLSVFIMLIAGVVSLFSGSPKNANASSGKSAGSASATAARAIPSAAAVTAATTAAQPTAAPAVTAAPAAKGLGDCTSGGDAKLIAPRAVIVSGIEAHALGSSLALGFAASARDAVATTLDPSTLAPTATVRTRAVGGDVKRVVPMLVSGKLAALPDVERKADRLQGRRVVTTSSLIDIGHADGGIVWAPHGRDSFAKLFNVDADPAIDALRAVPLAEKKGIALVFRQGNTVKVGVAKGDNVLEADGGLSSIAGLGQVGTPAIAVSGDKVMVAWADHSGAQDDPWKVRVARFTAGTTTEEAATFPIPEGGIGGPAMSPSLASLGGGRFLLAWTEGPTTGHQIRAVTVGADGMPTGSAIAVSAPGLNAGQPSAIVGPDGAGTVAFLAARGKALEVYAAPITCPSR